MSDKRLTGRRVYEPTGEVRRAKTAERFFDATNGGIIPFGPTCEAVPILRLVEDFREVERPSADAVALAHLCRELEGCYEENVRYVSVERRKLVDSILAAEAAFAEPEKPTAVSANLDLGPDAEVVWPSSDPPRPVDASDAVALARSVMSGPSDYDRFDIARDILKRSETK